MAEKTNNPRNSQKNATGPAAAGLPLVNCPNYRNLAENDERMACLCPHFSPGPSLTPIWIDLAMTRNFSDCCPRLRGRTIHNE